MEKLCSQIMITICLLNQQYFVLFIIRESGTIKLEDWSRKFASSGMTDDDLEKVLRNLRNDAVVGPGQDVMRRFLNASTPNSRLTPEARGGRVSNSGSVTARGFSPVRNTDFRNPTEEPSRVFL